jgi:hypothetical protein
MHTGGGGERGRRGHQLQKLDHKNAIKHENRGPPPKFSDIPKYHSQKKLKMTALFI